MLVLQLHIAVVPIVGFSGILVVPDAPFDPLEEQRAGLWSQKDGVGEKVADGVDGDAELGRAAQEASTGLFGLVSFALAEGVSCSEDRNRSARSLASSNETPTPYA